MAAALPTPEPRQTEVPPAQTPTPSGLATLAVAAVVITALNFGREIFLPIVLAMLLSFVLAPLVDLLRGVLGRVLAVIASVLLALGILVALGGLIGVQLAGLARDLPRYEYTIRDKVQTLQEGTIGRLPSLVQSVGRRIEQAAKEAAPAPGAAPAQPEQPEEPRPLPVEVHQPAPTALDLARNVLLPVLQPLATMGIVLVVVIFILLQREDLRDRMIRLFGSKDLHKTTQAMDDAARRLSRYFLTQLGLSASYGVVVGAVLWLIGVPSPVLWGVLAMLMRFVPYVGTIFAAGFPVLLAAAVDPGWTLALTTLAFILAAEGIMGQAIEPMVYGQSTGLSPFAVVVSAIFWTWLWGPVGLLIATPLTLCLVVLGRHVERMEFLDVLLGDRPALTPAETFYQRMLAGDPDEALDHAEELLKERPLSVYYDEVALKGLQLAANDAGRGELGARELERIRVSIRALVEDLADHTDREVEEEDKESADAPVAPEEDETALDREEPVKAHAPPLAMLPEPWRGERAVMCIAGRGVLDEAAAGMLAQLLRKHGLGARDVPHEAVSRSNVLGLDVTGVAMVCISYLEISGNPAHLRYLIKRLRQKVGNAPILVGLWPAEDEILKDERLRKVLGADYYVTSLRQAVECCVAAAVAASEARGEAAEEPRGRKARDLPHPELEAASSAHSPIPD